MAPPSPAEREARRSIPARVLSPLQRAVLSAIMSSAVIILERRIRTALRRGESTGTPADRPAEPRTDNHSIHARS
jgi:hypothetical protein